MKTLHFQQLIRAPRQKVWQRMLDDAGYRDWTSAFCEGSCFEGRWQQGARMKFLSPDGFGMDAVIAELRPQEYISIKLLGEIRAGEVEAGSTGIEQWTPAYETYSLRDHPDGCELTVTMDCTDAMAPTMLASWPKALARLQALAEMPD
ncbi:MAG: SRPBCC family protein [Pseudomonadota bacterium]